MLNLKTSGENCVIFNWHSSRAAHGISFFRVATKDDEGSTNWRNNIVVVITLDMVMKAISKEKLEIKYLELYYRQEKIICHK